jgi:hypothetical protein
LACGSRKSEVFRENPVWKNREFEIAEQGIQKSGTGNTKRRNREYVFRNREYVFRNREFGSRRGAEEEAETQRGRLEPRSIPP